MSTLRVRRCLASTSLITSLALAHPFAGSIPDPTARIAWCRQQLEKDPNHYPVLAQLGAALFDQARFTGRPSYLAEARDALSRSLKIQPSLAAQKTMAAISNYSHRFADAVDWTRQARQTDPTDSSLIPMLMEAQLALGELDEAGKLVTSFPHWKGDFHLAAARGAYFQAAGKHVEASESFEQAAILAEGQNAFELRRWALLQSGRVWIKAGEVDRASGALEKAAALGPGDPETVLVQAEALASRGMHAQAFELYEKLLSDTDDAQIHALAFEAALAVGNQTSARRHFVAAESGFQRAIDAGEVYTLGALARLYFAANVKLDKALEHCEENLKYQRDAASKEFCFRIRSEATTIRRN